EERPFIGYPRVVDVYNTGGWVIENEKPSPIHGGAMVLVDENLDAVSVHMFHDVAYGVEPSVAVSWPRRPGGTPRAFRERIAALIDPRAEPWASFSNTAAEAVAVRHANLVALSTDPSAKKEG